MPIYVYRCIQCGHTLDALQKLADAPLTDCPACGAAALKKQLTAPGFRLKGSGWYETDFKRGGQRNVHADERGSTDAGGSTDKSASSSAAGDATPASAAQSTTPAATAEQ